MLHGWSLLWPLSLFKDALPWTLGFAAGQRVGFSWLCLDACNEDYQTNLISVSSEIVVSLKTLALRYSINRKFAGADPPSEMCWETQIHFIVCEYFCIKKY